jgi:hypothetical protein
MPINSMVVPKALAPSAQSAPPQKTVPLSVHCWSGKRVDCWGWVRYERKFTCQVSALLLTQHIQDFALDLPRNAKLSACMQCALIVERSAIAQ